MGKTNPISGAISGCRRFNKFSISIAIWQRPIAAGRERDGFQDHKRSINPPPINLSRTAVTPTKGGSFVKCRQIECGVFQAVQTGVHPQNSLEIDSNPRKSDAGPPIKRRKEIGIGKREFRVIWMRIVRHKQNRPRNQRTHRVTAEHLRFSPLQS
jgi:hypothetical protein